MAFDANDLSPHEHFVVERTRAGEVADFTAMAGPGGAKPAVRAGFLRKLLLQLDPSWAVRTPGVRLRGARIEGALDLTDCSGAGGAGLPALALVACEIPETVDLSHARLARVSFAGSKLAHIEAMETRIDGLLDLRSVAPIGEPGHETLTANLRGIKITGDVAAHGAKFARGSASDDEFTINLEAAAIGGSVLLDRGFEAFGCVWLHSARIGGSLQCEDARFLNRTSDANGSAIVGDNAIIGGDVCLRGQFLAEGSIKIVGANIRGNVDLEGSIRNEGAYALVLRDTTIGGALLLDGSAGCKIAGAVCLMSTKVGGNFDARGAEIVHRIRNDAHGCVIEAPGLNVSGAVLLQGANIKGEVFLADGRIAGYLAFGGGRFINGGGWAIRAPNVRVGGNVSFEINDGFAPHGQKTVIEGGAKFDRVRIDGNLSWANLELRGPGPDGAKGALFSLADAMIAGPIQARGLVTQQDALIDASGASCTALDDDIKTGWGVEGARLDLDGFSYERIDAKDERWSQRLKWLNRSGDRFSPQPYSHAAQVYARAGRREDARRILLAQHDKRTFSASAGPLTWALSSLFGAIAGYGLAPIRIARALVLYLAVGVAGVLAMNAQGALVTPQGQQCNGAVEPALYAVDVALPINLGQESRCGPGRTARAELSPGVALGDSEWRLFEGAALWKWAHALYAILGAILTALAVITFSGTLKPKDN